MSQNVDIGLSFGFMMYRRRKIEKNDKSYTFVVIKSKLEPKHTI